MATETLNREELISAIWRNKGKVGLVAESLGVTAKTIYNYADRYATVKNAIDDARLHADEVLVDSAELKLRTAVLNGEAWAVRYTLGTKGRNRGYVEQNNVQHSGSVDLQVKGYVTVTPDDWDADAG